ncbi:hypothetical protein L1987_01730 [Smallanthus sonchifolius]|uniref:Uncharacterized protein n=1 Tax=Smallanthus sonchifolius TaxID=185202 RepID=A0ACB9K623_9ASTR|nr:hypothetical protein L1987_01730 [Smallanthus sonchifolius]
MAPLSGNRGYWAQDCPRNNQYGGGPEYQSNQENYNQDYHPNGPPEQDNYQSELDAIRSDVKELSKVVHEVVKQQESLAKHHQTLLDQVVHLAEIVATLVKESGILAVQINPKVPKPPTVHTLMLALLDLGAYVSIIPGSLYDQHDFGPLQRVQTTVVLADQTPTHPRGIVKDMIVKVGEFYYPMDFFMLDCVTNTQPTIILCRPFLATAQTNINCAAGTVRMRFRAQKLSLKIFSNLPTPKANKCGSSEKVNHTVENDCFVSDRLTELKHGKTQDKGKKRVRKRKPKGKKPQVPDAERELFALFVKAWRTYDD